MDIADSMINCYHGIESIGKPYNLEGIMEDQSFESKGKSNVNSIDWHGYATILTSHGISPEKHRWYVNWCRQFSRFHTAIPLGRAHARRHSSLPESTPKQPEYRPRATAASRRRVRGPFG